MHLAATEKYYQALTFENRNFNKEERKKWMVPLSLGEPARKKLVGNSIDHYLEIWDEAREETLNQLKTKDDEWLNSMVDKRDANNYWAWYHVMEHQANHMGQIRLILSRISE